MSPSRLRDTDLAERVFLLKRAWVAATAGVLIGAMGGYFAFGRIGGVVGALAGGAAILALSGGVLSGAAHLMGRIHAPSGSSTPSRHGFSQADALILRERFAEAATLLEHHAIDQPHDPEAYLRLARLHRDHLRDDRRALEWFAHARAIGKLTSGVARIVADEVAALEARRVHSTRAGG